jgi:lipopolysaccharide transport system ATP-binding protein
MLGQYAVTELHIDQVDDTGLSAHGVVKARDGRRPQVAVGLARADGTAVYGTISELDGFQLRQTAPGRFEFSISFSDWRLLPGGYTLKAHAMDPEGMRLYDTVEREFMISGETRELGLVKLPHRWE